MLVDQGIRCCPRNTKRATKKACEQKKSRDGSDRVKPTQRPFFSGSPAYNNASDEGSRLARTPTAATSPAARTTLLQNTIWNISESIGTDQKNASKYSPRSRCRERRGRWIVALYAMPSPGKAEETRVRLSWSIECPMSWVTEGAAESQVAVCRCHRTEACRFTYR